MDQSIAITSLQIIPTLSHASVDVFRRKTRNHLLHSELDLPPIVVADHTVGPKMHVCPRSAVIKNRNQLKWVRK